MMTPTLMTRTAALAGRQAVARPLSAAQRHAALEAYYQDIIRPCTDLEAFARLSDMAAHLADGDLQQYIADMTWLIMGVPDSLLGIAVGPVGRWVEMAGIRLGRPRLYRSVYRFGSSWFRADDKGNQVQHFWFSLIVALHCGERFADLAALYHEWNPPVLLKWLPGTAHGHGTDCDVALSRQGIELAQALAEGSIRPDEVAGWLRSNL